MNIEASITIIFMVSLTIIGLLIAIMDAIHSNRKHEEKFERSVSPPTYEIVIDEDEDDIMVMLPIGTIQEPALLYEDSMFAPYQRSQDGIFPFIYDIASEKKSRLICDSCGLLINVDGTKYCICYDMLVSDILFCERHIPRLDGWIHRCSACGEVLDSPEEIRYHHCKKPTSNDECPEGHYRCWSCETPILIGNDRCHICGNEQGRND